MTRRTHAASLLVLAVAGCDSLSGVITRAPTNWSEYSGDTITVRGTAGNMPIGPIVRLADSGYVALNTTQPWAINFITRPVEVHGKIVSGAGTRTEPYVLQADTVKIVDPALHELPPDDTDTTDKTDKHS